MPIDFAEETAIDFKEESAPLDFVEEPQRSGTDLSPETSLPSLETVPSLTLTPAGSSEELTARNFYEQWRLTGQLPTVPSEGIFLKVTDPLLKIAPRVSSEEVQTAIGKPGEAPGEAAKTTAGIQNAIADAIDGFTSPLGIVTLGIGTLPKVAQSLLAAGFAAHMASTMPEQTKAAVEAIKAGDTEAAARHITGTALTGAFVGLAGRHAVTAGKDALAGIKTEAAKVVGPVTEASVKATGTPAEAAEAIKVAQPVQTPVQEAPVARETALERVEPEIEQGPSAPAGITMPQSQAPVGPVPETPVRASEIVNELAEVIDRPIRIGHIGGSSDIMGIFKPGIEVARLRKANDIPVATHEAAHALERIHRRAMGNGTDVGRAKWTMGLPADVRAELQGLDYNPKAARAFEGFAEFVRHWMTMGDTATVAPKAHQWFEQTFLQHNPELGTQLGAIRDRITAFRNQGAVKRVEATVQFDEPQTPIGEQVSQLKHKAARLWVDDLADLERVEKDIAGGDKLALGEASPTKIARMVTQASGTRAKEWARHGMTDFAGNRTGPALKEIFSRSGIAGDEKPAVLYAVARRAVELHERGIDPGITKADAETTLQSLRTPEREAFANEIRDWNKGALEYLKEAGGLSDEALQNITTQNEAYIPFFRVWGYEKGGGFGTGGRKTGDTPQAIKRIKGSGREIRNPIETMQEHANQIIATADKVRVARALVDLVESKQGFGKYVEQIPPDRVPSQFKLEDVAKQVKAAGGDLSAADLDSILTIFSNSPKTPTGGNIVAFVRNGKRQFYELDPELYRSLQALDYVRWPGLINHTFGALARMQRLGATGVRAGFTLITNPIRDFSTMLLQTRGNPVEVGTRFFKHLAKQIGFTDNEIKNIWRATGGELSQPLGLDRASLRRAVDDVLSNTAKQKAWNVIKHPIELTQRVLSFTEAAPRLAEFETTLREMGWKPGDKVSDAMAIEAANRAAEVTVNFRRGGHYGRLLNQIVAFFNPSVQGLSKFNRSHRDAKVSSVLKGTALITIPTLLNWWANKDDEDWQALPDWVKYGFLNFKIGGEWVRIPTPFEWWYAYGAIPMASANVLYQKKPEEMKKVFGQAVKQLTPPVVPSGVVPFVEAGMNKSFYTGRPIVSASQERLAPQEQVRPNTSATARKVSEVLGVGGVDVSPAKIEHVLNGETGGFWGDAVGLTERLAGLAPETATLEPADMPIVGRLFIRDGSSSIIDEFYTELEHLSAKKTTWQKLLKEGKEERAEKYELKGSEAGRLQAMENTAKVMTKLREQYRDSKTREERNVLWREMKDLAKDALEIE